MCTGKLFVSLEKCPGSYNKRKTNRSAQRVFVVRPFDCDKRQSRIDNRFGSSNRFAVVSICRTFYFLCSVRIKKQQKCKYRVKITRLSVDWPGTNSIRTSRNVYYDTFSGTELEIRKSNAIGCKKFHARFVRNWAAPAPPARVFNVSRLYKVLMEFKVPCNCVKTRWENARLLPEQQRSVVQNGLRFARNTIRVQSSIVAITECFFFFFGHTGRVRSLIFFTNYRPSIVTFHAIIFLKETIRNVVVLSRT